MGEQLLQTRQGQGLDKFLLYVANPFRNQFNEASILASAGSSLGISIAIFVLWCLIRPHNTVVYAPKLRNAGAKHAPPRLENSFFGWWKPLTRAKESDLVAQIGEDAVLFLRVLRMCRTIFFWLGLIGVGIVIPVNVIMSQKNIVNWEEAPRDALTLMSPELAWGQGMWAHVVMAYVFDIIIMYILFRNYVAVAKIRKNYFESEGYQMSLHSRTLMVL